MAERGGAADARFRAVVEAHGNARRASWSIQLQEDAVKAFRQCAADARDAARRAASEGDEDDANQTLVVEMVSLALAAEISMWIALKRGDSDAAWNYLIDAQDSALGAVRAHPAGARFAALVDQFEGFERTLFPPQVFMSAGMIIHKSTCSLCDAQFGECEHIAGRPYMGRFAHRVILEATPVEASVVQVPADRRCRVTAFGSPAVSTLSGEPV